MIDLSKEKILKEDMKEHVIYIYDSLFHRDHREAKGRVGDTLYAIAVPKSYSNADRVAVDAVVNSLWAYEHFGEGLAQKIIDGTARASVSPNLAVYEITNLP